MKHQISTSITINADIETVWKVFTDFAAYPTWNTFIKSISGPIEVGKKFKAQIGNMKFTPTTKVFKPQEEFTWLGRLFIPGIFDGRHSFVFEIIEEGKTRMTQKEQFKGMLVRPMKKKLDTEIVTEFNLMNEKLKELAEKKYA
jgi:hypothetical protein